MAKRQLKRPGKQTVRQRAQSDKGKKHTRKISYSKNALVKLGSFLKREYYLPLPDTKVGRFLNKRRYLLPAFIRDAGNELKQVTWPSRKETLKLTLAVFLFAIVFGLLIAVVDYGLDKLFRKVILKL